MSAPPLACIWIPELTLQIVHRRQPEWRTRPTAIVTEDRPGGLVQAACPRARARGVRAGLRLSAARSLCPALCAATLEDEALADAQGELFLALCTLSPRVEPSVDVEGLWFVDPRGLERLYGGLDAWTAYTRTTLETLGYEATLVLGHRRARIAALARVHRGILHLDDPLDEARLAAKVPLARLDLPARLHDELDRLAIRTVGDFLRLPPHELLARFGETAARLRIALADDGLPLQARPLRDPIREATELEPPDDDRGRIAFALKQVLDRTLTRLADRSEALAALELELHLDHAGRHTERLEPARPTLDANQLLELLRLRLEALTLPAPIERIELAVEGVRSDAEQLALFRVRSRRDLEAGARALARIKAALGDDAVVTPTLVAAHLPEASFAWAPVRALVFPRGPAEQADLAGAGARSTGPRSTGPRSTGPRSTGPRSTGPSSTGAKSTGAKSTGSRSTKPSPSGLGPPSTRSTEPPPPLVRRLLPRPVPLPDRDRNQPGWGPDLGPRRGVVVRRFGPHRISGGWWARTVERDYWYVETQRGDLLWIFYDRPRRRWFLHAEVD